MSNLLEIQPYNTRFAGYNCVVSRAAMKLLKPYAEHSHRRAREGADYVSSV